MFPIRFSFVWAALLAVGLAACDTAPSAPPPPPPEDDDIVAGVDLDVLFAPPTPAERNAVKAEWAQRDAALAARYAFSLVAETTAPDGATYRVYLGRDPIAEQNLFYGLVRIPPHPPGDQRIRPVLLVLPDGSAEVLAGSLVAGLPLQNPVRSDFVYAIVAYRGMTLDVDGTRYESPAAPSAYDRDADDALAFLAYARSLGASVLIDPARAGVIGLGRGGGVALLTAARNNPYGLVVDLAGPTDLFLDVFRDRVRDFLGNGTLPAFPAFDAIAADVLVPLREGGLSYDEARLALLRRSPRYFIAPPPYTVVAHGTLDFIVLPNHSRVLDALQGETAGVYLEQPKADHFTLPTDAEVISLVTNQLTTRLGGP